MEYKFTFTDGSEAIAHYGVLGMKWGVQNAETLRRYQNSGSAKRARKKMDATSDRLAIAVKNNDKKRASRYSRTLAVQQTKYHVKEAKKGGDDALKGPGGSVRRAAVKADNALDRAANRYAWGSTLCGSIGTAVSMSSKQYKNDMQIYMDHIDRWSKQNLQAAESYVKSGKYETDRLLKKSNPNFKL